MSTRPHAFVTGNDGCLDGLHFIIDLWKQLLELGGVEADRLTLAISASYPQAVFVMSAEKQLRSLPGWWFQPLF